MVFLSTFWRIVGYLITQQREFYSNQRRKFGSGEFHIWLIGRTTNGIEIESMLCFTCIMLMLSSKFHWVGGWCKMYWLGLLQRMVGIMCGLGTMWPSNWGWQRLTVERLQCNHQIFLCGHGYGRLGSQIRSEFFHVEHAIIYYLRKTIWWKGGRWRMLGAISVIILMNWCCMFFGSVG